MEAVRKVYWLMVNSLELLFEVSTFVNLMALCPTIFPHPGASFANFNASLMTCRPNAQTTSVRSLRLSASMSRTVNSTSCRFCASEPVTEIEFARMVKYGNSTFPRIMPAKQHLHAGIVSPHQVSQS